MLKGVRHQRRNSTTLSKVVKLRLALARQVISNNVSLGQPEQLERDISPEPTIAALEMIREKTSWERRGMWWSEL